MTTPFCIPCQAIYMCNCPSKAVSFTTRFLGNFRLAQCAEHVIKSTNSDFCVSSQELQRTLHGSLFHLRCARKANNMHDHTSRGRIDAGYSLHGFDLAAGSTGPTLQYMLSKQYAAQDHVA